MVLQKRGPTLITERQGVFDQTLDHDDVAAKMEQGAQVLVVDGVSDAFGGNENARTEVKRFVNALLALIPLDGGRSQGDGEIFAIPPQKSIDHHGTKASRYGLRVFMVGTERAKDLLLGFTADGGRIKRCDRAADGTVRTGRGAGRMHWYKGVRPDFFEQLADSEVKIPSSKAGGRRVWTLKAGKRNEGLDTAVYCEHAARALRLHLYNDAQWVSRETKLQAVIADAAKKPTVGIDQYVGGRFMPTSAVVKGERPR